MVDLYLWRCDLLKWNYCWLADRIIGLFLIGWLSEVWVIHWLADSQKLGFWFEACEWNRFQSFMALISYYGWGTISHDLQEKRSFSFSSQKAKLLNIYVHTHTHTRTHTYTPVYPWDQPSSQNFKCTMQYC